MGVGVRPNLFEYHDYRSFLRCWFDYRKETERGFSLRKLASQSGISPGYLPRVLSSTRNLSPSVIVKLSKHLGLDARELSYFELIRELSDTTDTNNRQDVLRRIEHFKKYYKLDSKERELYQYLAKWHYVAIREMVPVEGFQLEPKWIQERLRYPVSLREIREAIQFLEDNGHIEVVDGKAKLIQKELHCHEGVYRAALGEFHKEMFRLAGESFERTPRSQRKIRSFTVSLTPNQLRKIKRIIEDAHEQTSQVSNDEERYGDLSVYHMIYCAFPITTKKGSEDEEEQAA